MDLIDFISDWNPPIAPMETQNTKVNRCTESVDYEIQARECLSRIASIENDLQVTQKHLAELRNKHSTTLTDEFVTILQKQYSQIEFRIYDLSNEINIIIESTFLNDPLSLFTSDTEIIADKMIEMMRSLFTSLETYWLQLHNFIKCYTFCKTCDVAFLAVESYLKEMLYSINFKKRKNPASYTRWCNFDFMANRSKEILIDLQTAGFGLTECGYFIENTRSRVKKVNLFLQDVEKAVLEWGALEKIYSSQNVVDSNIMSPPLQQQSRIVNFTTGNAAVKTKPKSVVPVQSTFTNIVRLQEPISDNQADLPSTFVDLLGSCTFEIKFYMRSNQLRYLRALKIDNLATLRTKYSVYAKMENPASSPDGTLLIRVTFTHVMPVLDWIVQKLVMFQQTTSASHESINLMIILQDDQISLLRKDLEALQAISNCQICFDVLASYKVLSLTGTTHNLAATLKFALHILNKDFQL